MADGIVMAVDAVKLGHTTSTAVDGETSCCPCLRTKAYYSFYMVLLFIDVVTDTVEVAQFAPEEKYTTTTVTNLTYLWYVSVAGSWLIFFYEVIITYYSWKQGHSEKILNKMRFVHITLVMIIEDILLCLVGVILAVLVPGQSLSGVINKISVCITLFACFLQYISSFYPSCTFYKTQTQEPTKCFHCICTKAANRSRMVCYFILLASIALCTSFMKLLFVFVSPDTGEDNAAAVPSLTTSTATTKSGFTVGDVFRYTFLPLGSLLFYSSIVFCCIRCFCLDNGTIRRNPSMKKVCSICCCARIPEN